MPTVKINNNTYCYKVSTNLVFSDNGPEYYIGRVKWYHNNKYLYSESTGITRTFQKDAVDDATWLARDRMV